jgi:hypothetical protein
MTTPIGMNPGNVYTQTQQTQGKVPVTGTFYTDQTNGKIYRLCLATASTNLTDGMIVNIDTNAGMTQVAANAPAPGTGGSIGVIRATITCSLSMLAWVQVYGTSLVLATTSTNPATILTAGSTAGNVDHRTSTLSAVIEGITLTATSNTLSSPSTAMLNYPRWGVPSH